MFIGCFRKLLNWDFNSIITEYRSFAGSKSRYGNEQFIELFDLDLVCIPKDGPEFYIYHRRLYVEENRKIER
jgi:hypothetical protein